MRRFEHAVTICTIIALLSFVPLLSIAQPLSGTKTIGGTTPDYATISAAISAMNTSGVSGSVTFLIRGGTYNEAPDSMLASAGTSSTSPVTFKPADTLGVIINKSCTTSATTAFNFINTPNITFDGSRPELPGRNLITVNALTTNGNNCFRFCNGASNIVIKHINMSVGGTITSTNTRPIWQYLTTNYTPQANADNDSIMFCDINGGYYGMFLSGLNSPAISASNWVIYGNKVHDFYMYGIYFSAENFNTTVEANEVYRTTPGTAATSYGIAHTNALSTNNRFLRNNIHDLNCTSTTTIYGLFATAGSNLLFANNMVNLTGPSAIMYGMDISVLTCNVYFNTVHLSGTTAGNSSSFGLFVNLASSDSVANNIVVNDRTGGNTATYHCALFVANTNPFLYSDYNIFCAGADTVGDNRYVARYGTANYNTLNDLRQVSTYHWDAHSFSIYPTFVSATDLHLSTAVTQAAESAGIPFGGITNDFDNDTRSATAPDIGCDEGNFLSGGDFFPPVIHFTALGTIPTATARVFTSVITDNIAISGGTNAPRVYYKLLNDVNWSFHVADSVHADTTYFFTIPAYPLGSTVDYYLAAQDSAGNVTSFPAGATGSYPPGTTPPPVPAFYYVQTMLSGVKTVGGTNPDFPSISAAITALNMLGTSTGVTFQIRGGTYTESPDSFMSTIATGPNARAIFETADTNGVIINSNCTANASTAFNFINSPYVTFDGSRAELPGRNFIAVNAQTTNGNNCFRFCNGASHIVIKNIDMTVGGLASSQNTRPIWQYLTTNYTPQANADSDTIMNCNITGGYYGMFLSGLNSPVISANYWYVGHNTIHDFSNYGIDISAEDNNCMIEANEVYLTTANTSGACYGIAHTNALSTNNTIVRNWIHDLSTTTNGTIYGIQLSDGPGLLVANNMVSITGTGGYVFGISQGAQTDTKLYYNTVRLGGTGQYSSYALSMTSQSSDSLANNIFINDRTGAGAPTYYDVALNLPVVTAFAFSDNNLIVAVNDSLGDNSYAARYNGAFFNSLADLRQSGTYSWDASSILLEPTFVSDVDLHLNTTSSQPPESAGRPVWNVTNDFDNQQRNTTRPDIGCDEGNFRPLAFGTIVGDVRDSSAAQTPIPGAMITAGIYNAVTDSNGHYVMDVRSGTYTVSAMARCYANNARDSIVVDSLGTATVNFEMLRPELTANVTSFDLLASPGQTQSTSFTIHNTGNSDLHWVGHAVSNPHTFDKSGGGATIGVRNQEIPTQISTVSEIRKSSSPVKATGSTSKATVVVVNDKRIAQPTGVVVPANPTNPHTMSTDELDTVSLCTQNFSGTFPPTGWTTSSTGGSASPWQQYAGSTPTWAFVPYYTVNSPGEHDYMLTPVLDLSSVTVGEFDFNWAYGTYANYNDTLYVAYTLDNGATYTIMTSQWGNGTGANALLAPGDETGTGVTPPTTGFGVAQIPFPAGVLGQSSVRFAFIGVNEFGNHLFITNVNIYSLNPPFLSMSPTQGTIPPGQVAEISVQAVIDSATTVPATWTGNLTILSDACPETTIIPVSITIDSAVSVGSHLTALPYQYKLYQNYPNPFNPSTEIRFDLKNNGQTKLAIYNVEGRQVAELLNQKLSAGAHSVRFSAERLATGVYFYRIESGTFQDVKKMVLIK